MIGWSFHCEILRIVRYCWQSKYRLPVGVVLKATYCLVVFTQQVMTSRVCWLAAASGAGTVVNKLLFVSMTSTLLASSFVMPTLWCVHVISYVVVERQHSIVARSKLQWPRNLTLVWPDCAVKVVFMSTVSPDGWQIGAEIEIFLPG